MANTFKNIVQDTISAAPGSPTSVLTAGASEIAVINSIYIGNQEPSSDTLCNIAVTSGAVTAIIGPRITIPSGQSLIFDKPITLENNDILQVDGGNVHVMVNYLLVT